MDNIKQSLIIATCAVSVMPLLSILQCSLQSSNNLCKVLQGNPIHVHKYMHMTSFLGLQCNKRTKYSIDSAIPVLIKTIL